GVGNFGVGATGTGSFESVQAGILANVHLTGAEETVVEELTQAEVNLANTILAAAASGGQAAINAAASSIGFHAVLGAGDHVMVGGLLGAFQAGNGNSRFVVEDQSIFGATGASATLLKYGGSFTAGTGNNTFYFVGQNLGHVAVNQAFSASTDTLDFSRFQSGITLNLALTSEQTLAPGLFLTLSDGMGISNVIGTGLSDTITPNGRNGTIMGQALLDPRAANAPAPQAVPTQIVFLDFDTYTTDLSKQHYYTPAERPAILAILQADYAMFPFVQFTTTAPTSGSFETLFFNRS